jgi:hypothetical protein
MIDRPFPEAEPAEALRNMEKFFDTDRVANRRLDF